MELPGDVAGVVAVGVALADLAVTAVHEQLAVEGTEERLADSPGGSAKPPGKRTPAQDPGAECARGGSG